jgi:hypothetical protein
MKYNQYPQDQRPGGEPRRMTEPEVNRSQSNFAPAPEEVARRAYFTYVNQGSRDGHEVQHWLQAEAELIAERNLTRVHGFHNRS